MIYRELKVYKTPLGLKKANRADLCERVICGHTIFKIDLLPAIFEYMVSLTRAPELNINYPNIREALVTALGGDCSDEQYAAALTRVYDNSPFFETYINYHFILCRNPIDLKGLVLPLVGCLNKAAAAAAGTAGGTYLAEDSGYLYILDAYKQAICAHPFVEIR